MKDTGQSRVAASFLLAWWNAEECGGFDLTDLWRVDTTIAQDMVTIFFFVAKTQKYPDSLGHPAPFGLLVRDKRPQLQV